MTQSVPFQLETPQNRLMIWGSCVSRDLWSHCQQQQDQFTESWSLQMYVARQSFISAGTPVELPDDSDGGIDSAFKLASVRHDFLGNAPALCTHYKPQALMLDLIDERLGVLAQDDGYVTRSFEMRSSSWWETLLHNATGTLEFGTDEHFSLWEKKFHATMATVTALNIEHICLLHTPFAQYDERGQEVAPSLGKTPDEWNDLYKRYYETVQSYGIQLVSLPEALAVAHSQHQWGAAPFHYIPQAYEYLADKVREILTAR